MNDHCFAIPVYKDSAYLEPCIISILNQSVKTDLIICTSTPTEQNRMIAQKYHIPYFVNDAGIGGIAADWNFAYKMTNTKLVTIAHQDDIYCVDFASTAINSIDEKTLISFSNYADIHGEEVKNWSINNMVKTLLLFPFLIKSRIKSKLLKKFILSLGDPICCPSVTINKSLLPDFYFSPEYNCVLDWDAWYQLAEREGAFVFNNKRLMQHRVHMGSETTNQISMGKRSEEEQRMLKQIWGARTGALIAWVYQLGHLANKA